MANILVIGAGPIGFVSALMLKNQGHDVTVLEGRGENESIGGQRYFAIQPANYQWLQKLGAWPNESTSITGMQLSQLHHNNCESQLTINAADMQQDALAKLIPQHQWHDWLKNKITARGIKIQWNTKVSDLISHPKNITIQHNFGNTQADLAILATGQLGLTIDGVKQSASLYRDYGQTALVNLIAVEQNSTQAKMILNGNEKLVRLPFPGADAHPQEAIIWMLPNTKFATLNLANTSEVFQKMRHSFMPLLNDAVSTVGIFAHYPLRAYLTPAPHAPRYIALGNAAQSLHPLGAQGLNLGLRDVRALAVFFQADSLPAWDAPAFNQYFYQTRWSDRRNTFLLIDQLATFSSMQHTLIRWGQRAFLTLNQKFPLLQRTWIHQLVGN